MKRSVSDTDTIRRQNRGLVLDAIRRQGPLSRTKLAETTGLSNATITAISTDMIAQSILSELVEANPNQKTRGRPSVRIELVRHAAYAILMEIDVNNCRCSLVDYGGTLIDRIETPLTPTTFNDVPPVTFIADRIQTMRQRNPVESARLLSAALSVQGILERDGIGLRWSPVAGFAGHNLVDGIRERASLPLKLFKRGRLLAEGTHWLFPHLHDVNVATVFLGSTVAMGMSFNGHNIGRGEDAATEFGHMIHIPNGALCRCGTRGCIEAYAADYGVLRTAFDVPEHTQPAPAVPAEQFQNLIRRANAGDRGAIHAFKMAGTAIGYGLNRLMAVFDPRYIAIVGPGTEAFGLIQKELEAALDASLITKVFGRPQIFTHRDESEPIFKGLLMKALTQLDQDHFADLHIMPVTPSVRNDLKEVGAVKAGTK